MKQQYIEAINSLFNTTENNKALAIPDHEDVTDPEERDQPTPLEEGDSDIHLPPIPDRGFPGEDERVLEDLLT